jgi:hypothetical protein
VCRTTVAPSVSTATNAGAAVGTHVLAASPFFGAHVGSGAYIRVVPARAKPPEVLVAVRGRPGYSRALLRVRR